MSVIYVMYVIHVLYFMSVIYVLCVMSTPMAYLSSTPPLKLFINKSNTLCGKDPGSCSLKIGSLLVLL
jgi:hypothetical protein